MDKKRGINNRNLFLISQAVSAVSNYFPLGIAMLTKDVVLIGQVAIFQSLFTIFIAITRSGVGFAILKAAGNATNIQNPKFPLMVLGLLTIPTTLLYCNLSLNSDFSLFMLFCLILLLSIFQEFSRAKLISASRYKQLVFVDSSWLIASSITAFIFHGNFSFRSIVFIFFAGPLSSAVYIVFLGVRSKVTPSTSDVRTLSNAELFFLTTIPLITFVVVFILNIIWSTKFGASDLGIVRGLSFFFIPIQFLLSIFPHVILRERKSASTFLNKRTSFGLVLICATFSIIWASYSEILNVQTVLIVMALSLSMHSIIASQELALKRILENRIKGTLIARLIWGISVILFVCIAPTTRWSPLQLALIIAFSDVFYRLILNSRFLFSREGTDGD